LSAAAVHHAAPVDTTAAPARAAVEAKSVAPPAPANADGGPDGENVTGGPTDAAQSAAPEQGDGEDAAAGGGGNAGTTSPERTAEDGASAVDPVEVSSSSDSAGPDATVIPSETTIPAAATADFVPVGVNPTSTAAPVVDDTAPPSFVAAAVQTAASVDVVLGSVARSAFNSRVPIAASAVGQAAADSLPVAVIHTLQGAAAPAAAAIASHLAAAPDVPSVADAAARAILALHQPDAGTLFADAIAAFVHDSAALGTLAAITMAPTTGMHTRAWAASAAVIAADAVLLGQWYAARRREQRLRRRVGEASLPFCTRNI
jgi:hypothetical protein